MRTILLAALVAASMSTVACGPKVEPTAKKMEYAGPATGRKSSAKERTDLALTIYNGNFGLVRETRTLKLGTGKVELEYQDVAAQIQPETVHIKSMAPPGSLTVMEQNYRYDLLSPQKLLEKYVGKKVKIYRWNEALNKEDEFEAEVLSVTEGTVLKIGNEVTYGFPGRIAFPEVPANLIAQPTLVWLLGSGVDTQKVEVTYITQNLTWQSDYVMVVDDSDNVGDLNGWVTLHNHTGTSYENAKLKLVAGDVQKFAPPADMDGMDDGDVMTVAAEAAPAFKEEGFFEYHLYTLERNASVLNNEQKQVSLLEAHGIKLDKKLILNGSNYYYRGSYGQVVSNQKVGVFLDIENNEKNHLGMPLPKGTVRVYKADKSGAKQFIGEDRIDHTPRDEKIRIKMGDAFDVVGDRKQTDYKSLGSCNSESGWEISLRNHKDTMETVEVYEPVGGEWTIVTESHPHVKKDAHTFTFEVKVPAKGEVKVKYRVRIKWC